ncbi:MAG: sugar kinase [Candidatus Omnitrophica bacterium]|nr:sugar kinase [Candidatus Omnitrophota bacterium]
MILVVGSIALDSIETPHERAEDVLGGSATFICAAAAKLATVGLVGIVGEDFPERYRRLFSDWGVDTAGLEVVPGRTFRWGGRYHSDMIHRDTLFTELGVFETFSPSVPESFRRAPYVALGNIHPDLQHHVLDQMEKPSWVVADTMKLWIDIARDSLERLLGRVDAIVVNDEEARQLTGQISLNAAAADLLAKGPSAVIIKRGEHGASLHNGSSLFSSCAFPLHKVADTTGAGDTFLGGLVGWVARSGGATAESIKQGIQIGSCLASFTVESFGVERLCSAGQGDLEERVSVLNSLSRVAEIAF